MVLRTALTWISLALLTGVGLGSCVRAEKFDYRIAKATCEREVECGDYPDVETCMGVSYVESETYLDAAREAGRVDYDGAQAYRCVRAIKKLECLVGEDLSEMQRDCEGILSGNVEPDQPCMVADECVGELSVCGFDPACTDECCPGVCRFRAGPFGAGETCESGEPCESGTYCRRRPQGEGPAVCTKLTKVGEACQNYESGLDDSCAGDNFCNDGWVCEKPRKDGEACSKDRACRAGSQCREQVCVARGEVGDPCVTNIHCLRVDTTCRDGVCAELRGIGEACGDEIAPCVRYASCRDNICTERAKVGESCDFSGGSALPCYQELLCDEGICVRREPDGVDECPIPE